MVRAGGLALALALFGCVNADIPGKVSGFPAPLDMLAFPMCNSRNHDIITCPCPQSAHKIASLTPP